MLFFQVSAIFIKQLKSLFEKGFKAQQPPAAPMHDVICFFGPKIPSIGNCHSITSAPSLLLFITHEEASFSLSHSLSDTHYEVHILVLWSKLSSTHSLSFYSQLFAIYADTARNGEKKPKIFFGLKFFPCELLPVEFRTARRTESVTHSPEIKKKILHTSYIRKTNHYTDDGCNEEKHSLL